MSAHSIQPKTDAQGKQWARANENAYKRAGSRRRLARASRKSNR